MKFSLSLLPLLSLVAGQSVTVTSPKDGDSWDAKTPLKVTWSKQGFTDRHRWAQVTLVNTNDKGIKWEFDYVTSINDNSEFYLPSNAFINGANYKLKVGVFSDVPISTPVVGESGSFTITSGVDLDNFQECGGEWKFTNLNSSEPWKGGLVSWVAPGKNTPINMMDVRVKSANDATFSYTEIDKGAAGYQGGFYFYPELESGKQYYIEGLFHFNRRVTGAVPICKLKSEVFTYQRPW
ncbi:hypothetical protein CONCODRAFT_76976 [Conidiobolus coronatus NRRL 28638]|uniref:Uncharacterized protein n=1 Tax=Conidiobolus coronatus (strain ATCC 28846 / CBS 209.66 / NRRL 28638) TaxID=796925 RepID=A0A137PGH4_CONC2|nr:hypothetical protein CONCODRAFT_76976 [Conidiobolus coronatus NRRL 28638]|eukprot:KXN74092.1 hypothetical protein CONCODRAFT_76976 [Conidiobolus coronatus NRRL 28638]